MCKGKTKKFAIFRDSRVVADLMWGFNETACAHSIPINPAVKINGALSKEREGKLCVIQILYN